MMPARLDATDRRLLNLLQGDFPLVERPFAHLGEGVGLAESRVLRRVRRLKDRGLVRFVGAIFNPARLGYHSTLVALRVDPGRIDEAAWAISRHPGVSHNYARDHYYNLWFTLALPDGRSILEEVASLARQAGADSVLSLPAVRLFKIGVFLDMVGSGSPAGLGPSPRTHLAPGALSEGDRALIRTLQADLPLTEQPFHRLAEPLGLEAEDLLGAARSFLARGLMRRYGALLGHQKAGFRANAMSCWVAPEDLVERAGELMASFPEVSHCYQRETAPGWPYNLFAMIHGHSRRECQAVAKRLSRSTGLSDYVLLYSTREYKKERVRYFAEETRGDLGPAPYPVFLDIAGKRCLVVGGGEVAQRKVRTLLEHGAVVTVISPSLSPGLGELRDRGAVRVLERQYRLGDLEGAALAIGATDDPEVNEAVAREGRERGVLINVVDAPRFSSFIVPSVVRRGDVTIAVSTGGRSPALARRIRTVLEECFGPEYAALAVLASEVRAELKAAGVRADAEAWQHALDLEALLPMLRQGRRDEARKRLLAGLMPPAGG